MDRRQPLTLSAEDTGKLLTFLLQSAACASTKHVRHRNYTMALVMLDTGCRVGELVQLQVDQLWFSAAAVGALAITKDQAKNGRDRTIPITHRLRGAICDMQEIWWKHTGAYDSRFAFTKPGRPGPLTVRQVQRIIKRGGALSIGRDIHPHILRHTFASRLMRTSSMRVVQELLGHSSIASTQIYTHPNSDDCQKAIDTLNDTE